MASNKLKSSNGHTKNHLGFHKMVKTLNGFTENLKNVNWASLNDQNIECGFKKWPKTLNGASKNGQNINWDFEIRLKHQMKLQNKVETSNETSK
jgi:hypothetical protein